MSDPAEAEAARLAVVFLRSLRRWDQREFAEASGVDQRDISRYETGERVPRPRTLEKLAAVAGVSPARLGLLIEFFRQTAVASKDPVPAAGPPGKASSEPAAIEQLVEEVIEAFATSFRSSLANLFEQSAAEIAAPPEDCRADAERTWRRLQEIPAEHHRFVIEHGREYRTWAFCERLCAASAEHADDPVAARDLAELAVHVAEQPAGPSGPRRRLQGYAWGFVARARHRLDDLGGFEEARIRAADLWAEGESSPSEPLDETRWLALVVGLRPN